MGEMIKFGIKVALIIGVAFGLIAAFLTIFNLVTGLIDFDTTTAYGLTEMFKIVSLFLPIDMTLVFSVVGSLAAFKVAYWAQDKLIPLIDAMG